MCGRYLLRKGGQYLLNYFNIPASAEDDPFAEWEPQYNIAPTTQVPVILQAGDERQAHLFRWGLVPSWAKDPKAGPPLINARSETVAEKPSFRDAIKGRRCLIPASGFYEWKRTAGGNKQGYWITREDEEVIAFAGLYETWRSRDPSAPQEIRSCAIVTTEANNVTRDVHERMPVILAPEVYSLWLDPRVIDPAEVIPLLVPAPDELLVKREVGPYVNSTRNQGPECLASPARLFA